MNITLKTYLALLATNSNHLSDFIGDPQSAAMKLGLSLEDQAILLSGDPGRIYKRLAGDDEWWTGEKKK